MQIVYQLSILVSAILFLGYGVLCLTADGMATEFQRFGLEKYRLLIGALEVFGALGLFVGQWLSPVLVVSAGGLTLLMVMGVATRVRVGDSMVEMLPAAILGIMNLFIFLVALGLVPG